MEALQIGRKLVDYVKKGDNDRAIDELYSKDIVSVEAQSMPDMPAEMRGIDQIRGKNDWWTKNHQVHSVEVNGPFPHGDRFAVLYRFDITPHVGPMSGKRFQMAEVALYTVKNGKIVREEFFYDA